MVKKLLIAAIVLCLIFWVSVCLLIPNPLQVSSIKHIGGPIRTVNDLATVPANWQRWWPGDFKDSIYKFNVHEYTITYQKQYSAQIGIQTGADTITTHLSIFPLTQDSVVIEWKTQIASSINPFIRIKKYNTALLLKKNLDTLLDSLAIYASNREKVYGIPIEITRFTNPFMITTQATLTNYPTTESIYKTINTLRVFAKTQQAQQVDSPMINIEPMNVNNYLLRVALPIDRKLPAGKGIEFKQMVLGNTLRGTVTGGRPKTEEALIQMQNYMSDYRMSSPAIPFQSLTTNRQMQTDSTRWITKIYYPIF